MWLCDYSIPSLLPSLFLLFLRVMHLYGDMPWGSELLWWFFDFPSWLSSWAEQLRERCMHIHTWNRSARQVEERRVSWSTSWAHGVKWVVVRDLLVVKYTFWLPTIKVYPFLSASLIFFLLTTVTLALLLLLAFQKLQQFFFALGFNAHSIYSTDSLFVSLFFMHSFFVTLPKICNWVVLLCRTLKRRWRQRPGKARNRIKDVENIFSVMYVM